MTSTPVAPVRAAPSFAAPRWQRTAGFIGAWLPQLGWAIVSVGLFAAIWELCWYFGWPIRAYSRRRMCFSVT